MMYRSLIHIIDDAVSLRGIVALLEEAPATTNEVALTQHVSRDTALRLCKKLHAAKVIEHPTATRIILGVPQQVPQLTWQLTPEYQRGEIQLDAEKLAGGA